jgi:hypothetical protein
LGGSSPFESGTRDLFFFGFRGRRGLYYKVRKDFLTLNHFRDFNGRLRGSLWERATKIITIGCSYG